MPNLHPMETNFGLARKSRDDIGIRRCRENGKGENQFRNKGGSFGSYSAGGIQNHQG